MRMVSHGLALTFVHAVVCKQLSFVARERVVSGGADLLQRQHFGPDTCLEHVTFVGTTELEIRTAILCLHSLFGGTQEIIRYLLCTHIETYASGFFGNTYHPREGQYRIQHLGGLTEDILSVGLDETQTIVFGEYQLLGHLTVAGLKEDHVVRAVVSHGRFDHHIDREVGLRQIAFGFGGRRCVTVKMQRSGSRETGAVGDARDLEIIILVHVVTGYRFVET